MIFNPASLEPSGDPPVDGPSDFSPGEKALQGQVGALTRMVALDVVRVVVLRLVVDVVVLCSNVPLPDQQRMEPMKEI